jgi:transcription elongation factor GreA
MKTVAMNEQEKILMTREDFNLLVAKLKELIEKSKYSGADLETRQSLLYEISKLHDKISNAKIVDNDSATDTVNIGDIIDLYFTDEDCNYTYTLVGINSDPLHGTISAQSPLGRCIYGHKAGDKVSYTVEKEKIMVQIMNITKGKIDIQDKKKESVKVKR